MRNFLRLEGRFPKEVINSFNSLSNYYDIKVKTKLFCRIVKNHYDLIEENKRLKRMLYFNKFKI